MASGGGDGPGSDGMPSVCARVILQQCLSARLMVQPATETEEARFVQIGRGLIVYICFLKGATEQILEKMVKSVLGARLSESDGGKLVSVLDLPGDVLVIPQATLGGSLKGKMMQYHRNINKEEGQQLYTRFIQMCEETVSKSEKCREKQTVISPRFIQMCEETVAKWEKCREKQTVVRAGTYGNRQVFSTETNGPYSHILEF